MIDIQQPSQVGGAQQNQPLIRILSFDGGGIRGFPVAYILKEIEERTGRPLREQATIMVGTSTGGLISLLLSMRNLEGKQIVAYDIVRLYGLEAGRIFSKNYYWIATSFSVLAVFVVVIWALIDLILGYAYDYITHFQTDESKVWLYVMAIALRVLTIFCSYYASKVYHTLLFNKFSQRGLKNIVKEIFGDRRLDEATGLVGICTTDLGTNKSVLLNSYRAKMCPNDPLHNADLQRVARATSAAPTYFRHVKFETPRLPNTEKEVGPWIWSKKLENTGTRYHYHKEFYNMEDGGTSNNNPASLGLKLAKIYCKEKGYDPKNCRFQIISFGTGYATQQEMQQEDSEDVSVLTNAWERFVKYNKKISNAWKPSLQCHCDSSGDAHEDVLETQEYKSCSLFRKVHEIIEAILRLIFWPVFTLYVFTLGLFLRWSFKSDAGLIQILRRFQKNPFEMESKSKYVDDKLRCEAMNSDGRIQYKRVQFRIRPSQKDKLDDHSLDNMDNLIWRARRYIRGEGAPISGTISFKELLKIFQTEEPNLQKDDLNYPPHSQPSQSASH